MEQYDLTAVVDRNAAPKGTYVASVTGVKCKKSKSGNPMLIVNYSFSVDGDEFEVPQFIVLSSKSLFMVAKSLPVLMDAANETEYYDSVKQSVSEDVFDRIANSGMLLGAKVSITVRREEYDGELRSNVSVIKPISNTEEIAVSDDFFLES